MNSIFARPGPGNQCIGQQGEHLVTEVVFSLDAFRTLGPGGVQLTITRRADGREYLAPITVSGNQARWTLTAKDLSLSGTLDAQLLYLVNGRVDRSETYHFYVQEAVGVLRGRDAQSRRITDSDLPFLEQVALVADTAETAAREARAALQAVREDRQAMEELTRTVDRLAEAITADAQAVSQDKTAAETASSASETAAGQAQADALRAQEAAQALEVPINDSITASDTTWSSEKLQALSRENDNRFANALRGRATGPVAAVADVSPVAHAVECRVYRKNHFDLSVIQKTNFREVKVVETGPDYLILETGAGVRTNGYAPTPYTLRQVCPSLKPGQVYTLTGETEAKKRMLLLGSGAAEIGWTYGESRMVTAEMLDMNLTLYGSSVVDEQPDLRCRIAKVQLEQGVIPTAYSPFVGDLTAVTVTQEGTETRTFRPGPDGVVSGVKSMAPAMTFRTDNPGVELAVTYNRDTGRGLASKEELEEKLSPRQVCNPLDLTAGEAACWPVAHFPLAVYTDIAPHQPGAGDPSLSNPRPISGWEKAVLTVTTEDGARTLEAASGGTLYGGTVDWNAGTLTVSSAVTTLTAADFVGERASAAGEVLALYRAPGAVTADTDRPAKHLACDKLAARSYNQIRWAGSDLGGVSAESGAPGVICVRIPGAVSARDNRAWVDLNRPTVVYPVQPVIYPVQREDFRGKPGRNTYSSNTGDTTVRGWKNPAHEIAELQNALRTAAPAS